jgi:hypothetical protein
MTFLDIDFADRVLNGTRRMSIDGAMIAKEGVALDHSSGLTARAITKELPFVLKASRPVVPAKAGTQALDSRFRGNDERMTQRGAAVRCFLEPDHIQKGYITVGGACISPVFNKENRRGESASRLRLLEPPQQASPRSPQPRKWHAT